MEINQYLKEYQENGIVKVKNFINRDAISNFKKNISNSGNPTKLNNKNIIFRERNFKLKSFSNFFKIASYKNFAKKNKMHLFAESALKHKSKLYHIDNYFSVKSNDAVLDWHFDQSYSGKENVTENELINPDFSAIKFFIYLSPVSQDNGCLSYIKKSNKLAYVFKKLIYEKKIIYQPYWSLAQFLKAIKEKKNFDIINKYLSSDLINSTIVDMEQIIKVNKESFLHDYSCEAGDMLIFDEAGCHRGSRLTLSDRYVLRFLFKRT